MRGERDFESAAERGAVYCGDDGLPACLDAVADVGQRRRLRRLAELANVSPGDEVAPGADEQHGGDARVGVGGFDRGEKAAPHLGTERVDGRVVDGDDEDAAVQFAHDDVLGGFVAHGMGLRAEGVAGCGACGDAMFATIVERASQIDNPSFD